MAKPLSTTEVTAKSGNQAARILGSLRGKNASGSRMLVLALIIALVIYPLADGQSARVDIAVNAMVNVLLALGLNIVVGYAGLLDLGYGAFFAIGAYTLALLASSHFPVSGHSLSSPFLSLGANGIHIAFILMIPLAALAAAGCGVAFGAPTLRLRGDYLAIVTLGFGEIVPKIIANLGPNNSVGLPNITNGVNRITGIDSPPSVALLGKQVAFNYLDPRPWYYLALVIVAVSIVVIASLRNSRLGRAWAAIREDEVAAAHMGINIRNTRLFAFGLGAAFSGFAGLLEASRLGSVDYQSFGFDVSIRILVMVILGGIGSIPGVILGAVLISYLDLSWLAAINSQLHAWGGVMQNGAGPIGFLGQWLYSVNLATARPLIFGFLLIGIMLLRPQGIWPSSTRARELRPSTQQELSEENAELYNVRSGQADG